MYALFGLLIFLYYYISYRTELTVSNVIVHILDSDNMPEYVQWSIPHARHAVGLVYALVIPDKIAVWQHLHLLSTQYYNNYPSLKEQALTK